MFGSCGSTCTSLAPVHWSTVSTGFHVLPPSVVLKTPRSPPPAHRPPCDATQTMSGFVGCTTMRPMCSLVLSPMLSHVLPPSSERYTPSPQPTLLWLLFSPEPTHTVSGREGASVT